MKLLLTLFLGLASAAPASAALLAGIDVLERADFALLRGKRVGVITNHTGADYAGRSTVDLLFASKKLTLAAIFSPEHGFRGDHRDGDPVGDSKDPATGLPVFSLYGKTRRPTPEMLRGLDVLVFDIQDVGTRAYTYLSTMGMCMEEAARHGLEFVVLDRPNPLGGDVLEGPVLEPPFDFTGYFPVPVRHGMTPGEMARLHADVKGLKLRLTVVPLQGWTRSALYDETAYPWINPSPNIRGLDAALLYPGFVSFEASPYSVGRGTDSPFLWFGAPDLDAAALVRSLNAAGLAGARFTVERRTPAADIHAGKACRGVRVDIFDRKALRSLDILVHAVAALRRSRAVAVAWGEADPASVKAVRNIYRAVLESSAPPREILAAYEASWRAFDASRRRHLLY
ncbi:MAG: DUF1343 domain-containing protein [Elusimicrobia bacterium]|nr:DUF1343 domain-containing protein [Elusimicrobiota bacterium]